MTSWFRATGGRNRSVLNSGSIPAENLRVPVPGNPVADRVSTGAIVSDHGLPQTPPSEPDPLHDLRRVETREHALLSLIELSHELQVSFELRGTADRVLLNLMSHFGTTRAAIWLVGEGEAERVVLVRAYGMTTSAAQLLGPGLAQAFAERFVTDSSLIRLDELPESRHTLLTRRALASGIELVAPVSSHGELLGLLVLGDRLGRHRYGAIDLQYVGAAAGLAGTALENNRLYRQVMETNRQLLEANDHLTEMDMIRTQMVQNVNHELRTPLAIILGYLEPMAGDGSLTERHRVVLEAALGQARKLTRLVENLFAFSDCSSGGLRLECVESDPRPVLLAIAERHRANVVGGLRQFECDVATNLPRTRLDARRLGQALHLLIDNAVKFTPQGSRVRVAARRLDESGCRWLAIEVEDDGPGIGPQQLQHLFEPFRQGDGSTTRPAGGMGLGLALVAIIVRRMDGQVDAASPPGAGTRIRIKLPAAA